MQRNADRRRTGMGLLPVLALLLALPTIAATVPIEVDPGIPADQKTSGVSGNLSSIGADTLNNGITLCAEGLQKEYPNVRIQIEGKGSSTAPPALISATAQTGPMSRAMKPTEVDDFEGKYGYAPTQVRVAIDALAVYVNKGNALEKLTLPQVDAIFSKERKCGFAKDITTSGDLGRGGEWAAKPISLYGRNSASGTYGFFKEHMVCDGDFKDRVKEQPGSASVVQGVAEDRFGIGYRGIGLKTSGVKTVDLAAKEGEPYEKTEPEVVRAGQSPLSRFLCGYVNKAPNEPIDPLVREFLKFGLCEQGQEIVIKEGYLPVSAKIVETEHAKFQ